MKSNRCFLFLSVVLALSQVLPAAASMAVRLSLDDLVARAERVVTARLAGEPESFWRGQRIYTRYTFAVEEEWLGKGETTFSIEQPGGAVGKWAQKAHGFPVFEQDERVVLFLGSFEGQPRVVGMCQGVFRWVEEGGRAILEQKLDGLRLVPEGGEPIRVEASELRRVIERRQEGARP
ncbi:MAG: hypothetical protein GYA21_12025 [Myxococcales bacterium]|nr:hypothetical protein [Myxococcales bacterium]